MCHCSSDCAFTNTPAMKLIVIACLVALAAARPQQQDVNPYRQADREAEILSYSNESAEDGSNQNEFTASNGLKRTENIRLVEVQRLDRDGNTYTAVVPIYEGSYEYINDDGETVLRTYYTDEDGGFHVQADDIPVAPVPF